MVNVSSIENNKKQIIKNFKPEEFESYLKSLVTLYYESFLMQDKEKHESVNSLIDEAVKEYSKKYENTSYNMLVYEVNKANELLHDTLTEKEELAKYYVEDYYSNKIFYLIHNNVILKDLIEVYEKAPSEILLENTKHILANIESDLTGTKYILEEKEIPDNSSYVEYIDIIKEYYSQYLELSERIRNF